MFTGLALSIALLTSAPVAAEAERPITEYLARSVPPAASLAPQPVTPAERRDSVKNGAVIGAIVGGIVGGVGIGLLCHAVSDTDNPNCWKAALLYAGIGAGAGAGIGAGVDALFGRRTTFTASVRF